MFNKDEFCGRVRAKGFTLEKIAEYLGINPATLTRKLNGISDFTRNEIEMLRNKLSLSNEDIMLIFFA